MAFGKSALSRFMSMNKEYNCLGIPDFEKWLFDQIYLLYVSDKSVKNGLGF